MRRTHTRLASLTALLGVALLIPATSASAAINTSATAADHGTAIESDPALATGGSFVTASGSSANAVSDTALTSFPTDGSSYSILTSGNATTAPTVGAFANASNGGGAVRGDTDRDVSILQLNVDVPVTHNCLTVDFQFLSEEFDDFLGGNFNDAFIAELDTSTWTTSGSTITANDNFAFGPGGEVISVNTSGAIGMSMINGEGTAYDGRTGNDDGGATPLLQASTQITPGAHTLYLSIFDQGDTAYDSAVFLDNLRTSTQAPQNCVEGAELVAPNITKTADEPTSVAGGSNGYTVTIENPNAEEIQIDSITDDLPEGFSYTPGTTGGVTDDEPTQVESSLEWEGPFNVPSEGSIQLSFDVTVAEQAGLYSNTASAESAEVDIPPTGPVADILVVASPAITKTVDEASPLIGDPVEYTIELSNPNDDPLTVESISDALPDGFAYLPGSTSGMASADPAIVGQTLTWTVDDDLPGTDAETLSFRATVAVTPGTFTNNASASITETGAVVTGPTAPVTTGGGCSLAPTLVGTQAGETLTGGGGPDHILGLGGRDRINTLGAEDIACAGPGSDYVYGRRGADELFGDGGHDRLKGGNDADLIVGGPGHDAIIAGRGDDVIDAQDGTLDCIMTGQGDDAVTADPQDRVDPARRCPAGFWL